MERTAILVLIAAASLLSGCNRFGYDAHIESAVAKPGTTFVEVVGWLHDPYLAKRQDPCTAVRVRADATEPWSAINPWCAEWGSRPDVEEVHDGSAARVVNHAVTGLAKGRHTVCIDVVPLDQMFAQPFDALDCATVDVPFDQFDSSVIEDADVAGTTVTAQGWYRRPLSLSEPQTFPGSYRISWSVDGRPIEQVDGLVATATTVARPDVEAVHGPNALGSQLTVTLAPGPHRLCVVLMSGDGGAPAGGGECRNLTVA